VTIDQKEVKAADHHDAEQAHKLSVLKKALSD